MSMYILCDFYCVLNGVCGQKEEGKQIVLALQFPVAE